MISLKGLSIKNNNATMSDQEPRDVYDVCEQLLRIIPDTEQELIYELMQFNETLWNKAPEIRKGPELWRQLGYIMSKNVRSIDEEWQRKLVKVFNNQ